MQMSSQVASRGGHYGIDWPEVIGRLTVRARACVSVCARVWCVRACVHVQTDEATTVFPLVNLSKHCLQQ